MGLPVTGQVSYHRISEYFMPSRSIESSALQSSRTRILLRLFNLGIPNHVYFATSQARKVSRDKCRSMGYHHDATRRTEVVWPFLCPTASPW